MNDGSFLGRMASTSRERLVAAREREAEKTLRERALSIADAPRIQLGDFNLIAELKLRSPAAGALAETGFDRSAQLEAYARGGAAAISVLTEPEEFKGELAHLEEAAALLKPLRVPAMRKDFLVDPYQVYEAKAAGAGGVLVIATMLSDDEVEGLLSAAAESGLFVLLEAFDANDLDRISKLRGPANAPDVAPVLCGVNCRDLKTLAVDFGRFAALAPHLPAGLKAVAESGVTSEEDIRAVANLGYELALVGSALMQASDPVEQVRQLTAAGAEEFTEAHSCL
ncbi:MAG: indole-3-glycerol phosphate synthase TrpC [Gammaproteobacteria bacterium]